MERNLAVPLKAELDHIVEQANDRGCRSRAVKWGVVSDSVSVSRPPGEKSKKRRMAHKFRLKLCSTEPCTTVNTVNVATLYSGKAFCEVVHGKRDNAFRDARGR